MRTIDAEAKAASALIVCAVALLTIWFGARAARSAIRVSEQDLLPPAQEKLRDDEAIRSSFGDDNLLIVTLETRQDSVFDAGSRALYREFTELLSGDDYLRWFFVDPVDRPRLRRGGAGPPGIREWMLVPPEESRLSASVDLGAMTSKLNVTRSANAFVLHYPIPLPTEGATALSRLREVVRVFEQRHSGELRVRILGQAVVREALGRRIQEDLRRFMPGVVGVTFVLLFVAFRSLSLALLALSKVGIACVMTLGLLAHHGHDVSLFTSLVPVLLIAIGIADEIHLFAELLRWKARAPALSRRKLVLGAVHAVARPITATSATTAIAVLSFLFTDIPALRVFGYYCAIGTLIAWALTLTYVPAVLLWIPLGKGPRWVQPRSVGWRPERLRAGMALAVSAVLLPGIWFVEVNDGWLANFNMEDPVAIDARWIEAESTGLQNFDLVLQDPGVGWDTPQGLALLTKLRQRLDLAEGVNATVSLPDLILERVWELAVDAGPSAAAMPRSPSEVRRVLHTFRVFNEEVLLAQFLTADRQQTRVMVFMKGDDYRSARRLRAILEQAVAEVLGPTASYRVGGGAERGRVMVETIAVSQLRAIVAALLILFAVLLWLLSDLTLALKSLLAVSWALALVLGVVGWIGLPLGIASSCFLGIALGVGIDYSVHFAFARVRGPDDEELTRAIGHRVAVNVIVVGLGLSVLALSANPTIRSLGWLLAFSMIACGCIASVCFSSPAGPPTRTRRVS